jgi:chloramphenicol 3-O phosphotransferase
MALVIILHGASSSGKSTLAAAIRAAADRPLLHLSIDHLRGSGAWAPADYANWQAARPAFFSGFHRAVAGFADAGNDLILEHILDTPGWHQELQQLLGGHSVLFVGLKTPLDALQAREAARGDRAPGSAARDAALVHKGLSYDLELDGTAAPQDNARRICARLAAGLPRSRFFA